jgi:hypothetical protein
MSLLALIGELLCPPITCDIRLQALPIIDDAHALGPYGAYTENNVYWGKVGKNRSCHPVPESPTVRIDVRYLESKEPE